MYKLLLCWRYLKTRYLALACIISVMLGVATLIVVNSVMSGFSTKLRDRLHALLSDIIIDHPGLEGFADPQGKIAKIRSVPYLNDRIEAMAATMEVIAMLQYQWSENNGLGLRQQGPPTSRPVKLIGVEPRSRTNLGGFREHLVLQKKKPNVSFALPDDVRKKYEERQRIFLDRLEMEEKRNALPLRPDEPPPVMPPPRQIAAPHGVIVGNLIASFRKEDEKGQMRDHYGLHPGDMVELMTVGGQKLLPVHDYFVVVDYFKSDMSEYDNNYVFVELDYLQHIRTMHNRASNIQIKLKSYADADKVIEHLRTLFPEGYLRIQTWEDMQGPLLAAIDIEKGILNILLFLIICVAGFGILAIFSMIVAEKTRDIGVLKALGASNGGVLRIFLGYGLLLGMVGAGLGTVLGLGITLNINEIEGWISQLTGHEVFDRKVYYFNEIPTDVQVLAVTLVNGGAIAIAVMFSILPALRAAWLHPVRALRYE
jgi:lipoprotein-releasing system permease protein